MNIILCLFAIFQISFASHADVSAGVSLALLRGMDLGESTVFSPFSLEVALGMLNEGASGETKQELVRFLSQGEDVTATLASLSNLSRALSGVVKNPDVDVRVANRIFEGLTLTISSPVVVEGNNQSFSTIVRDLYDASFQLLDFNDRVGSAEEINAFVSNNTKGKIDDIVDENSLMDTVAVLVNAIYFNGAWATRFSEDDTEKGDFHGLSGIRKEDIMCKRFDYARYNMDHENVKVLSLEYEDPAYSFYAFLPKQNISFTEFRDSLNASTLSGLIQNVHGGKVYVRLPRFKIEATSDAKHMLETSGVERIFESNGDFSSISTNSNFKISDVKHNAFIELTEMGTEAAAASSVIMDQEIAEPDDEVEYIPYFNANHPFLFAILRDQHILFLGQFI